MTATYWACAQTHPRQEDIALRNLRRQNFEAFFPFFMQKKLKNGIAKGQYLIKPAFPGYVFIRLPYGADNWMPINHTLGVQRLLTQQDHDDEYRRPCRADFVDDLWRIRIMQTNRAPDVIPVGTTVKIVRGPFSERLALVAMSTAERVGVIMEVFARSLTLEFDVAAVRRLTRPVA